MTNAKTIFWYESEMEEEKNQTIYCLFTGAPYSHIILIQGLVSILW